jgi:hypothetical protein
MDDSRTNTRYRKDGRLLTFNGSYEEPSFALSGLACRLSPVPLSPGFLKLDNKTRLAACRNGIAPVGIRTLCPFRTTEARYRPSSEALVICF